MTPRLWGNLYGRAARRDPYLACRNLRNGEVHARRRRILIQPVMPVSSQGNGCDIGATKNREGA